MMNKSNRIQSQKRNGTLNTQYHTQYSHTQYTQPQQQYYQYQNHNQSNQPNYQSTYNPSQQTRKLNYDQQFETIYQQIIEHEYFRLINKHQKIRINKWLTKLSNISTNDLWKKNRNNYLKLIKLMFDCQVIIAPFLMMPPERDLHKLTPHQINVIIDQIDKIVQERQNNHITGITGRKSNQNNQFNTTINNNKINHKDKFNKVNWTQQSAYVDHQSHSIDKNFNNKHHINRNSSKDYCNQNDSKKTHQSSSVTAFNTYSKMTQTSLHNNLIPPKYPSSTQNINKSPALSKNNNISTKSPISSKQKCITNQKAPNNNFIKQVRQVNQKSPSNYFRKKQRFNTFETQQMGQQEYLMMMKNSSLQRPSPVLEQDFYNITQQGDYDMYECQSRQAIKILKCGFKLLQKIPQSAIQQSSIQQIKTMRRIMSQNEFLVRELQKQNNILQMITNRTTTRTDNALNQTNKLNQTTKLNEINSMNNTQKIKMNDKRKMKLTLISNQNTNRS